MKNLYPLRPDLRRHRAMPLLAEIVRALQPILDELDGRRRSQDDEPASPYREVHDILFEVLMREGVEVLTDEHRRVCGLPARGPDGWTAEELLAIERKRMEAIMQPPITVVHYEGSGGGADGGSKP